MTTAIVGGLLKLFSASSETDYEAALQKAEEPCTPYKKEIYDNVRDLSRRKTHGEGKKWGKKMGYTFGQSQAKELLCKVRAPEEGGADS